MDTASLDNKVYSEENTILLTLVNKLNESCNITITYERNLKDTGDVSSITESFDMLSNDSVSVRINSCCSARNTWLLNCLVITRKHYYTKIRFSLSEDTIANILNNDKSALLSSIVPYQQHTYSR